MAGRPRKPTSILKLEGAYHPSRHGDRSGEPVATGSPVKPKDMTPAASKHWDEVVGELIRMGIAKQIDQTALVQMCEWFSECKRLQKSKTKDYKNLTMWSCAHKQWRDLASRFGMTPSDRARLDVGESSNSDPAARFIG